jgi:hypothetical protein
MSFKSAALWRRLGFSAWSRLVLLMALLLGLSLAWLLRAEWAIPVQVRGGSGNHWEMLCRTDWCAPQVGDTLYSRDGMPWRLLALPGQKAQGKSFGAPIQGGVYPLLHAEDVWGWLLWFAEEAQTSPSLEWKWARGGDPNIWMMEPAKLFKDRHALDQKWRSWWNQRQVALERGALQESLTWKMDPSKPQFLGRSGYWVRGLDGRGLERPVAVDSIVGVLRPLPLSGLRTWPQMLRKQYETFMSGSTKDSLKHLPDSLQRKDHVPNDDH